MNRYSFIEKPRQRPAPLNVGDRVKANMGHKDIGNWENRAKLRGEVISINENDRLTVKWDNATIIQKTINGDGLAIWSREWLLHE